MIVPRDFLDLFLGTVNFTAARGEYCVETFVDIQYETADGGSGGLTVGFRYADGGWINLDTTYTLALSTGVKFPRAIATGT